MLNPLLEHTTVQTKQDLRHVSATIEAVANHAPAGSAVICLAQHARYFEAFSTQYVQLAEKGATVVVAFAGTPVESTGLHQVQLDPEDSFVSYWGLTLLTPDSGAYVVAEDMRSFDPRLKEIEAGRQFASAWGFNRQTSALVAEFFIDHLEPALPSEVVHNLRELIAQAHLAHATTCENALCAATEVILKRAIGTDRQLRDARSALDVETVAASQDCLTQLLNRRGFDRWAGFDEGSGATLPSVGLILIDIDNFKSVNDTMGHLVGDLLLQKIAQALRNGTRPTDILCRWGGDEFLVACPGTGLEELSEIADRLIAAISALSDDKVWISASAGLHVGPLSAESLTKADFALYNAKSLGGSKALPSSLPMLSNPNSNTN